MDSLCLRGIEAYGYHGVLPEERVLGQTLIVDLKVGCDLRRAGLTDDLESSISYVDLAQIVQDVVANTHFKLLEAVAEAIAVQVLALPKAERVHVRIEKPRPPIPRFKGTISIEIVRQKG